MLKSFHTAQDKSPLLDIVMAHCEEMISVKSLDLRYLDCNQAFLKHFGLKSREEALGKSIFELIPSNNIDLIKENLLKVIEEQTVKSYSFKIYTNNTSKTVQQISTPVVIDNEFKYILTISRDITQEEVIRNQLYVKNNQLNTLMEYLPLLVYMKDKDRNYIIGSKNARNFVENGFDPYANDIKIDMKKSEQVTLEEDEYVLNNCKILRREKEAIDSEGHSHWYRILKAPIVKEDNVVDGLVTIAKNIDSDKEIENQKDLFIATLVHDLKNPLLAQISGMELLSKGYFDNLTEAQAEMLNTIIESANYMKEMLYTLINTYKYDNGNIVLIKSKTDMEQLIKTCIKEHSSLAQENNIHVIYNSQLDDEQKYLVIDSKQVRRVITNLLNNGITYAFKNSDFIIETQINDDKMQVRLTNFSPVMDEETRKHLFEKYISGSNKYQKVGFGLGMYLSKKVMEAHGGDIIYEGEDTTNCFILEFPLIEESSHERIYW